MKLAGFTAGQDLHQRAFLYLARTPKIYEMYYNPLIRGCQQL